MPGTKRPLAPDSAAVLVRLPDGRTLRFSSSFDIGREPGCDIEVADGHVSRRHAEVTRLGGEWLIRDLQSSNGLLVDGSRVDSASLGEGAEITLGVDGPTLRIEPEHVAQAPAPAESDPHDSLKAYAQHYFEPGNEEEGDEESVGSRTVMIRKAFQHMQQKQRRSQRLAIAAVALVALAAGGYALYAHRVISKQTAQAEAIFYSMKAQDIVLAGLEQQLARSGTPADQERIAKYLEQRRLMQNDYESYVAGLYDRKLNEKDKLILRVTRLFGECDVAAPPEYVGEVMRYIHKWQSTGRFRDALKRAQELGTPQKIAAAFNAQNLPPQYFYLAMQESDFIPTRSGPPTRWGIAKGMWQFIPETGARYGLKIGPLSSRPGMDSADERLDWEKATPAAAKYIKEIYSTDAQASGLLVMASYNWGEYRVIDKLKQMPANPKQRNFWKFLEQYKERMPLQTYEYVFYIVSAAVIGENPRLFGFDFDNPLASVSAGSVSTH